MNIQFSFYDKSNNINIEHLCSVINDNFDIDNFFCGRIFNCSIMPSVGMSIDFNDFIQQVEDELPNPYLIRMGELYDNVIDSIVLSPNYLTLKIKILDKKVLRLAIAQQKSISNYFSYKTNTKELIKLMIKWNDSLNDVRNESEAEHWIINLIACSIAMGRIINENKSAFDEISKSMTNQYLEITESLDKYF